MQNDRAAKPVNAREEASGARAQLTAWPPRLTGGRKSFISSLSFPAHHYQLTITSAATVERALWTFSLCIVMDYRAGIVNTAAVCKGLLGARSRPALGFMIWGIYSLGHLQFGAALSNLQGRQQCGECFQSWSLGAAEGCGAADGCSEWGSMCSEVPPAMIALTETELNINGEEKGIREQGEGSCVCFVKAQACLHVLQKTFLHL